MVPAAMPAASSGVLVLPKMALRCGKRPHCATTCRCASAYFTPSCSQRRQRSKEHKLSIATMPAVGPCAGANSTWRMWPAGPSLSACDGCAAESPAGASARGWAHPRHCRHAAEPLLLAVFGQLLEACHALLQVEHRRGCHCRAARQAGRLEGSRSGRLAGWQVGWLLWRGCGGKQRQLSGQYAALGTACKIHTAQHDLTHRQPHHQAHKNSHSGQPASHCASAS